jgi:ABC-type transport system substrate-binding protein
MRRRTLLLALSLVVGACAGSETASTTAPTTTTTAITTTTTQPDLDGPFVIAENAEQIGVQIGGASTPFSLNPFIAAGWSLPSDLDPLLFGGAWRPGPDGDPVPDIVESLPHPEDGTAVVGADGSLLLTYRIRPDARWDDGTPVTSADFALTLQIVQDPDLPIVSGQRDLHETITDLETVSDSEFTVTMGPPFTMYRHLFPVVVPAHAVDPTTFAEDWSETLWPSAGRMRLVSFERFSAPVAGVMTLKPNREHPDAPSIGIRIDFYQRDDRGDSIALEAFLDGDADVLSSYAFDWWHQDEIAEAGEIASSPPTIWEVLFLQPGPQRLAANPESQVELVSIRRAINAALLGQHTEDLPGDRITSLVEYFLPGIDAPDAWGSTLLGSAPIGPIPLVYESTNGDTTMQIGQAVEPLLEAAGFDIELRFDGDSQAAFERFGEGDFEAFAIRLVRLPGSTALYDLFDAFGGEQEWFPDVWPDAESRDEFRAALDAFAAELDPDARIAHLIDAELVLVGAMTVIPLVTREREQWAFHPDRIIGPADYDGQGGFYANVSEWQRP